LDESEQQVYVKTVVQMKKMNDAWRVGKKVKSKLYDVFVHTHAEMYNSKNWQGTSLFLPAHKWYLWVYESALIYTAYQNYKLVGLSSPDEAWTLSVPYWDWLLDYDSNEEDTICAFPYSNPSGLLDANDIGSATVQDTTFV
jgi:hypothetical protein